LTNFVSKCKHYDDEEYNLVRMSTLSSKYLKLVNTELKYHFNIGVQVFSEMNIAWT